MRFGKTPVPGSLFQCARERMLRDATFTPEDIRAHLLATQSEALAAISAIPTNQGIIANRVMRACVKQLVASGEVQQLKRGVWARSDFLAAAARTPSTETA